jgi:hypothetical protein
MAESSRIDKNIGLKVIFNELVNIGEGEYLRQYLLDEMIDERTINSIFDDFATNEIRRKAVARHISDKIKEFYNSRTETEKYYRWLVNRLGSDAHPQFGITMYLGSYTALLSANNEYGFSKSIFTITLEGRIYKYMNLVTFLDEKNNPIQNNFTGFILLLTDRYLYCTGVGKFFGRPSLIYTMEKNQTLVDSPLKGGLLGIRHIDGSIYYREFLLFHDSYKYKIKNLSDHKIKVFLEENSLDIKNSVTTRFGAGATQL